MPIVATYIGTVTYAEDATGYYGAEVGLPVIARFVFDPDKGMLEDRGHSQRLSGTGADNPMLSATVQVGERLFEFPAQALTTGVAIQYENFEGQDWVVHRQTHIENRGDIFTNLQAVVRSPNDFATGIDLSLPLSYDVQPEDWGEGVFQTILRNPAPSGPDLNAFGLFSISNVTIAPLAVPEPAGWGLLALAFGLLVVRRRQPERFRLSVAA